MSTLAAVSVSRDGVWRALKQVAPVGLAVFFAAITVVAVRRFGFGWDDTAYWAAWHRPHMYAGGPETWYAYLYSPAFAQAVWPLTQLPLHLFAFLWSAITAAIFLWLLWPLGWQRAAVWMGCLSLEIVNGNIWALIATVLVLGFTRPGLWAFPLLTKITSAFGLVWFAARREWRNLLIPLAVAATVAAVSAVVSPELWRQWIVFLIHGGGRGPGFAVNGRFVPPIVRLPAAAWLAWVGGRRNKPVWLVWAVAIGSPVLAVENLAVLAAIPRLNRSNQ